MSKLPKLPGLGGRGGGTDSITGKSSAKSLKKRVIDAGKMATGPARFLLNIKSKPDPTEKFADSRMTPKEKVTSAISDYKRKQKKVNEGVMAIPVATGVASKVIPAAAATVGAIGTFLQAKKKGKDLIKPKKGEAKKTKKLIDKYKKTAKIIKPKEGEIAKQRELLSKLEKRITKQKKGEKKEASKTVKDFLKARKKEGETMYRLKQDAEIADKGPGDLLPAAKKTYLDKLLRNLRKEEVMAAPTNSMGGGAIAGSVEAGDNPPVKKKKRYIYGGTGSRKMWMTNK